MEYRCRLGTSSGKVLEGVYASDSEEKLRRDFESKGLHVLWLQRKGLFNWPALSFLSSRRISSYEFLVFNQQLAALLKSGMTLVQSLELLRQRIENQKLKSILNDVHDRVRAGESLSKAFNATDIPASGVYIASLLAGEKSGNLVSVIRRYVTYVRLISGVRRKTVSALIYPAILLLLSLVVVSIIIFQVVPEFASFYQGMGSELPIATRSIMFLSSGVRRFAWLIIIGLAAIGFIARVWLAKPERGLLLDRLLLRLPGVGSIALKFSTSQIARTLATLLGGGVPLVSAIDIAAKSTGNRFISRQLLDVSRDVREGQAFSVSLTTLSLFPPLAIRMVEVGESTGALQDMLNNVGDFFDEEIETTLGRFTTVVEPVLLIVMGLVIAGLLLALYMPLLQLGSIV